MGLMEKVKEYGILGSLRQAPGAIRNRVDRALYRRAYERYQSEPIDERLVVFESEGDLSDNAYALYDHMREAGYLERYRVVWAVDDVESAERLKAAYPEEWGSTEFVGKFPGGPYHHGANRACARALATCRWHVFDHNNLMGQLPKRKGQTVVYLSHGCGYKAPKGSRLTRDYTYWDLMTATGPLAATGLSEYWGYPLEQTIVTGYPRLDYLLRDDRVVTNKVYSTFHFDRYRKTIFWMPTFRQSNNASVSEDYIHNQTGLPLFETLEDLREFSNFLKGQDVLMVLKLHHLQADLPVFQQHFENMLVVRDEQLHDLGLQLYQFIRFADAMISDYSSIAIDYLVMDRPLVFTLDDYEEYDKSRGLFPPNAIDYMPGYHVYTTEELEGAISEIVGGADPYREARAKVVDSYHTYRDSGSAERVLRAISLDKHSNADADRQDRR